MEVLANALDERVRPAPSKTCSCGCPFLGGVLGAWCGGGPGGATPCGAVEGPSGCPDFPREVGEEGAMP